MNILTADLSLRRPAFVWLSQVGDKLRIDDILVVDSKKEKNKCHSELLSDIGYEFCKRLYANDMPDLFIREAAVGTFCHGTTMTLNKVVGITDMLLWRAYRCKWEEPYLPVSVKKLVTGSGKASKEQVNAAVQQYLEFPYAFEGDDESDAVAVAVAWLIDNGRLKRIEEKQNASNKP